MKPEALLEKLLLYLSLLTGLTAGLVQLCVSYSLLPDWLLGLLAWTMPVHFLLLPLAQHELVFGSQVWHTRLLMLASTSLVTTADLVYTVLYWQSLVRYAAGLTAFLTLCAYTNRFTAEPACTCGSVCRCPTPGAPGPKNETFWGPAKLVMGPGMLVAVLVRCLPTGYLPAAQACLLLMLLGLVAGVSWREVQLLPLVTAHGSVLLNTDHQPLSQPLSAYKLMSNTINTFVCSAHLFNHVLM